VLARQFTKLSPTKLTEVLHARIAEHDRGGGIVGGDGKGRPGEPGPYAAVYIHGDAATLARLLAVTPRQQHLAEVQQLERLRGRLLRGGELADARDGLLARRRLRREQYPG